MPLPIIVPTTTAEAGPRPRSRTRVVSGAGFGPLRVKIAKYTRWQPETGLEKHLGFDYLLSQCRWNESDVIELRS